MPSSLSLQAHGHEHEVPQQVFGHNAFIDDVGYCQWFVEESGRV